MTEAKQQEAGRTRFLLLPPLSAAEREAERAEGKLQIPAHRGQSFRRIADSVPVIADSF